MRLDIRRIDSIKKDGDLIGNRVRVKVVKNKVSPPFKQAEFDIMYGTGISKIGGILDAAANADIINKAGAWYSYGDDKLGQGRENAKIFLEENPAIFEEIEKKVRKFYELPDEPDQESDPEAL